jgi:YfiH family protein
MTLQAAVLSRVPGILHGFGDRREPLPASLSPLWEKTRPQWKQVHGTGICDVRAPGQECGEVDALYTFTRGQAVAVVTADCVPVLMARRDGKAVAAIHAGWRGVRARILGALWARLNERGEKPADWVAAIGPAIGPCCYEVSEELAADFVKEFSAYGAALVQPRHRILDLPAIQEAELRALGLGEVELLRACTRCSMEAGAPRFFSYRREGGGTRQWSMIAVAQ